MLKRSMIGFKKPRLEYDPVETRLPELKNIPTPNKVTLLLDRPYNRKDSILFSTGDTVKTGQKLSYSETGDAYVTSTGVFIPLIVVNCILLGRAEAFAYKNNVLLSIADGLGIGIGFTLALGAVGSLREILGTGTFMGASVFGPSFEPFAFVISAPGAFVCLGLMLCIMNLLGSK